MLGIKIASAARVSARRNIVANYLSRGWSAIMGLAFIPVYTRLMGVEAMGVVGIFVTLQAICMLLDAGLSTTLNREMALMSHHEGNEGTMRDLLRTFEIPFWVAASLAGLLVVSLAPFISHGWVHERTLSPSSVESAIRLMGIVLFLQLPISLYSGGLLGLQKQLEFSVLNATWYTLRFAGAVLALKMFGPTLSVFFGWQVIVAALATALSALTLWQVLPRAGRAARFDRTLLASRWKFAAGLGAISITLLVLNNVDKIVLSKLVSLEAFGFYTLSWTLANAIRLVADPIFITFFPRLSQAYGSEGDRGVVHLYHRISQLMSAAVIPFGLTLAFFAPEAMLIWTRSPEIANQTSGLLRLLAIGNVCLALTIVPYALQLASGWTSLALWSNSVAAGILAPLLGVLAFRYGTLGGAIAWVILNSTYLVATVCIMHRRLLRGSLASWAVRDVARPLVAVLLVLAAMRALWPSTHTVTAALITMGISFAFAELAALAATPLFASLRSPNAKRPVNGNTSDFGHLTGVAKGLFNGKRACFFVKTDDPSILERNEFYKVDMRILEDLGFEVVTCTSLLRIPKADVYFIWWWTWAFAPLLRAKLVRKPAIIVGTFDHVMPGGVFQVYPHRKAAHRALIRWVLKTAEANIVSAEDQRELMAQSFQVRNLVVSPHVLATDRYCPAPGPREPFFLTICWMHEDNAIRKCVATSIRAMSGARERLPGFKLIVAGDKGSGYPALAQLVDELHAWDIIEFAGLVTVDEKVSLLQRCCAYVQPTLAEGFGVAVLEGMSCGAPIVASPVGGLRDVLGDCALFVDGHDAEGLADALCRVATDTGTAEDLSRRGRDRAVERFSYERRYQDFDRVLSETMR